MPPMLSDVEPWASVAQDLSDVDVLASHRTAMSQKRALVTPVALSIAAAVVGRSLAARRGTVWPLPPGANAFRPIVRPVLLNASRDAATHGRAMRCAFRSRASGGSSGDGGGGGGPADDEMYESGVAAPPGSIPPKSVTLDIAPFTAVMLRGNTRRGPRCSGGVCVCVFVCACACFCVCVLIVCVRACVWVPACVRAGARSVAGRARGCRLGSSMYGACNADVAMVCEAASSFVAGALGRRWSRGGGGTERKADDPRSAPSTELPDDKIVE